jgi:type 1 glutamine amidotransferase/dienelactone hydrolase
MKTRTNDTRATLLLVLLLGIAARVTSAETEDFAALGPYPVGVRTFVLVDESRDDAYSGGKRTLVTEVWYPAVDDARGKKATTFSEFFGKHRDAAHQLVEHFGGKLEDVDARFRSIGVRGAKRREGKFPLLVFSHGNGGIRHQNVFQMDHLASHGYIVVSPDHTGNAGVTPLPEKALPYDRNGRGTSAKDRPLDVSFLITHCLAESGRGGSFFEGALDADRIGVLGHSFGGFTACKVAETDKRVKAIIPMTVAYGKRTSVPCFVMLGNRDSTMKQPGNMVSRMYYQASKGPKYLLTLKRGGHFSFTDMDRIVPDFGDGIGKDKRTGEEFLPIDRAKSMINAYSLAFFEAFLRQSSRARAFLNVNVDPVEIQIESANLVSLGSPAKVKTAIDGKTGAKKPPPPKKHRVLIVAGDDVPSHDWRTTTPKTREIIERDGRLQVFVCEDPRILETSALSSYDVVVLNFRNPPPRDPGEKARASLARYVAGGGGLVALHFAVYAFPGWDKYRDIIGRVWVGRQDGKKISGHTPRGPFLVKTVDGKHPISDGLGNFDTDDELYSKLQGDAKIHVLLDAHSEYSKQREPIAWTREYGKGRVFVTVLGHDVKARTVPEVELLVRRATAWAAGLDVVSQR